MNRKVIAIPALALAAGLSLAACGPASVKGAAPAATQVFDYRTGCCSLAQRHYSAACGHSSANHGCSSTG